MLIFVLNFDTYFCVVFGNDMYLYQNIVFLVIEFSVKMAK